MAIITITVTDLRTIYTPLVAQSDEQLQPFVDIGNLIVNEQLLGQKCTQSDARLELIAEYLAAHFADMSANGSNGYAGALTRDKLGEADQSYAAPPATETGYMTSRYGQTALALDMCGLLKASTIATLKAQFEVVGTPPVGWPPGRSPYRIPNEES